MAWRAWLVKRLSSVTQHGNVCLCVYFDELQQIACHMWAQRSNQKRIKRKGWGEREGRENNSRSVAQLKNESNPIIITMSVFCDHLQVFLNAINCSAQITHTLFFSRSLVIDIAQLKCNWNGLKMWLKLSGVVERFEVAKFSYESSEISAQVWKVFILKMTKYRLENLWYQIVKFHIKNDEIWS